MITLRSGNPGSGKSLSTARDIIFWLNTLQKNVICNFHINTQLAYKNKKHGAFTYVKNEELTPDYLYKYSLKYLKPGIESQCLVVIDEAQVKFSSEAMKIFSKENKNYRFEWSTFFTQHRHLGFDFIVISQRDRYIDPLIRGVFEYNYECRKANNLGLIGQILTIFRITFFVEVQRWCIAGKTSGGPPCGTRYFFYSKKYSKLYDSFAFRAQIIRDLISKYGFETVKNLVCCNPYMKDIDKLSNNSEYKKQVKKLLSYDIKYVLKGDLSNAITCLIKNKQIKKPYIFKNLSYKRQMEIMSDLKFCNTFVNR